MAAYNLRQLKYFSAVVECGSVAEASRKLYIAQPSVSTAIRQLEDSFNVQLFIRQHASGMSLTPAGTRFYRKAQELAPDWTAPAEQLSRFTVSRR